TDHLLPKLADATTIDKQIKRRDLALSSLVTNHHFDIARAMQSRMLPNRQKIKLTNGDELIVFPGLTDADYETIIQFARTEQWPITPLGMFIKLQNGVSSESLEEAFFHTPFFMSVEMLFGRLNKPVKRSELLQMVLQGNWELLSTFYSEQRVLLDLSPERRQ